MNTIIHAAFRRDLSRFEQALARFPDGALPRAAGICTAWDNFSHQLHQHHQDEETLFWPALQELGWDDTTGSELHDEHADMTAALAETDARMAPLRATASTDAAAAALRAVQALAQVLLAHLAHEERDLEPFTAAHNDSLPMKRARKLVRKAHSGNAGTFFSWLMDGADADAARALRREIPPPVLFLLTRTTGRAYRKTVAPVWATP